MKIIAYIVGFAVAVGCFVFPFVTHATTHGTVALILFGAALLASMILMVVWDKNGTAPAKFDLDQGQWVVIFAIIAAGVIAAVVAGAVIKS